MLHNILIMLVLYLSASCFSAAAAVADDKLSTLSQEEKNNMSALADQRRTLIMNNLMLTPDEGRRFWSIYAEYEQDVERLLIDRLRIYEELGGNFDELSDDEARAFVNNHWGYVRARTQLLDHYLQRFSEALPGKKLARYYQIEAHIRAAIDAEVYRRIPLVQ